MQHRDKAEMSGIGSKPAHRLGDGAKQDRLGGLLVPEGHLSDLLRQGEDNMEIADRQKLGLPAVSACGNER
ncbi:hypothetical protein VP03_32200 [Sinorhizobium meliloti]|nr:hypothetical protein VP03_32200 [Sinorhizobium meliloti]